MAKSGGKGFTPKPRRKAVNPIETDSSGALLMTKSQSAEAVRAQLVEDNKRQIKYGPQGKLVPKAGTNSTFK